MIETERRREQEDRRQYIDQREVYELWKRIEKYRELIAHEEAQFDEWREKSDELNDHWRKFLDAGGISADDYDKFCKGTMRHRLIRSKKGLRLVRTNRKTRRVTRWQEPGDDAA